MNKQIRIVMALVALATGTTYATLVDLGPSGVTLERSRSFSGLEGIPLAGQSLSLDFAFAGDQFVRVYSTQWPALDAMLVLQTSAPFPGFLIGSGYVIDSLGQRYSGSVGRGMSNDGRTTLGLFPFWTDTGVSIPGTDVPLDIYSIHYEMTLPSTPGVQIVSSQLRLFGVEIPNREGRYLGTSFSTIGIGPGIPEGIPPVPESSSTLLLLAIPLILFFCYERRHKRPA